MVIVELHGHASLTGPDFQDECCTPAKLMQASDCLLPSAAPRSLRACPGTQHPALAHVGGRTTCARAAQGFQSFRLDILAALKQQWHPPACLLFSLAIAVGASLPCTWPSNKREQAAMSRNEPRAAGQGENMLGGLLLRIIMNACAICFL